jgi:hypothetical protein
MIVQLSHDEAHYLALTILRGGGMVRDRVSDPFRRRILLAWVGTDKGATTALEFNLPELQLLDELIAPEGRGTMPSGVGIVSLWEKIAAALLRESDFYASQDDPSDRDTDKNPTPGRSGDDPGAGTDLSPAEA